MSTMNNKGMLYESIGEYEKALECYNMFLDSRKKINGKGSINTTSALDNIGSVLKKQGKYKEAMKVLVECL
jgi:tetratricopeptide (TPR) repeat protein